MVRGGWYGVIMEGSLVDLSFENVYIPLKLPRPVWRVCQSENILSVHKYPTFKFHIAKPPNRESQRLIGYLPYPSSELKFVDCRLHQGSVWYMIKVIRFHVRYGGRVTVWSDRHPVSDSQTDTQNIYETHCLRINSTPNWLQWLYYKFTSADVFSGAGTPL